MNYIDFIILLFLIIYGAYGYYRGFLRVLSELAFLFLSLFFAFILNGKVTSLLRNIILVPPNLLKVISFLIIWVIFEIFFTFLEHIIYSKIPERFKSSPYNKFFGICPAVLRGIFLCAILLTIVISMPVSGVIKERVTSSKIGSFLVSYTSSIEKKTESLLSDAVNETFTLLTVKPGTDESVDLKFETSDIKIDEESERIMLELINKERTENGLSSLELDIEVQKVARNHSKDMLKKGYFAHDSLDGKSPFDRMEEAGIKFITAGENIALAPNVYLAHQGLMDSPGHRENILNSEFGKIGIGVQDGGIYGKMFTQDFTN